MRSSVLRILLVALSKHTLRGILTSKGWSGARLDAIHIATQIKTFDFAQVTFPFPTLPVQWYFIYIFASAKCVDNVLNVIATGTDWSCAIYKLRVGQMECAVIETQRQSSPVVANPHYGREREFNYRLSRTRADVIAQSCNQLTANKQLIFSDSKRKIMNREKFA
jgi:hypothetical protein